LKPPEPNNISTSADENIEDALPEATEAMEEILFNVEADAQFLKASTEALIFASTEPLSEAQFLAAMGKGNKANLEEMVAELNEDYQRSGRAFEILKVAGGFQFFTRPDYAGVVRRLFIERARTKLSRAALETLAVVAFRGPVTKAEIDEIRGVDCGGVLRTLLDRRLAAVRGRAKILGRPLLYETTPEFLKHFGLSDLSDLPRDSELLREWGEPRAIDEAVDTLTDNPDQVDMQLSEDKDNGRLAITPTEDAAPQDAAPQEDTGI
jgi:segregation and condensation protein B